MTHTIHPSSNKPMMTIGFGETVHNALVADFSEGFVKILSKYTKEGKIEWVAYLEQLDGFRSVHFSGTVEGHSQYDDVVKTVTEALFVGFKENVQFKKADNIIFRNHDGTRIPESDERVQKLTREYSQQ